MLTLFSAPLSRATTIRVLIEEMGVADHFDFHEVSVARPDGGGGPDPLNPHPEKKVPFLIDGDDRIRESGAIVAYLTDRFPEAGLGRPVGHPQRGAFLSWLFYYQGVIEPVLVFHVAQIDHPVLARTFRDLETVFAMLSNALDDKPYVLGDAYSAADLLLSSPFHMLPQVFPRQPEVQAWIRRCAERPALKSILAREFAGRPT